MTVSSLNKKEQESLLTEMELPYKLKDEMNFSDVGGLIFAGYPQDQKTVTLETKHISFAKSESKTERVTISASDNCRLPLPSDAKVFVALIALTTPGDFKNQLVNFNQSEILKILNWTPDGRNYERLKEALNRLRSIRFIFENSWYSNGDKNYISEDFNILDSLKIVEQEKQGKRVKEKKSCSFKWSDVLYKSFKENNVKDIKLEYLQTLSDLAFAMYRYLDKKFYFKSYLEYDMEVFAKQMGINKTASNNLTKIKSRLIKASEELEVAGFIKPLPVDKRFQMKRRGEWTISFSKLGVKELEQVSPLQQRLINHGLKAKQANKFIVLHGEQYVEKVLEYLENVALKSKISSINSTAAWLVSAFNNPEFRFPNSFKTSIEIKEEAKKTETVKRQVEETKKKEETKITKQYQEKAEVYEIYLKSLSVNKREELEEKAFLNASSFLLSQYEKSKKDGGTFFNTLKSKIVQDQIERELGQHF